MEHYILVKWKTDTAEPRARRAELNRRATAFWADAASLPGVTRVRCLPNVVDRPNRFDLMIVLSMNEDALPAYDASTLHHSWKETFAPEMESKAVFDSESNTQEGVL